MLKHAHGTMAAASILAMGLLTSTSAVAQAPPKGVHHFAIGNNPDAPAQGQPENTRLDLSADVTEGAFSIQDEMWSPTFNVPLHYHKRHAEIFYIISGAVEWTVGGETQTLHAGEMAYIPPNTPHKVRVVEGKPLHTLFVSTPGGYEDQGVIEAQFPRDALNTPAARAMMARLADFNALPGNTPIPSDTAGPAPHRGAHHFALEGKIRKAFNPSGNVDSKIVLSGDQSEGRYTVQDENWPADFNVELHYHKGHSEIFYLLGGAVEWTVGGETHVMHAGDLVYIPADTPHKVHVTGGQAAHMLFMQAPGGYETAIDLRNAYSEKQRAEPAAKAAIDALHDFHELPDANPYKPVKK